MIVTGLAVLICARDDSRDDSIPNKDFAAKAGLVKDSRNQSIADGSSKCMIVSPLAAARRYGARVAAAGRRRKACSPSCTKARAAGNRNVDPSLPQSAPLADASSLAR